jgi:hypothetical protein
VQICWCSNTQLYRPSLIAILLWFLLFAVLPPGFTASWVWCRRMSVRSLFLRVHLLSCASSQTFVITHPPHALSVYLHSRYKKPRRSYEAGVWSYCYGESSCLLGVRQVFSLNSGCRRRGLVPACTGCPRRQSVYPSLVSCTVVRLHSHDHLRHVRSRGFPNSYRPTSNFISSGLVVDQARKNGFTFRNRDELTDNLNHAAASPDDLFSADAKGRLSSEKKVSSDEFIA